MLILLTIFLYLFIPLVMLIMHIARPKFNIQGFLAVLAALAGWIMVLLARSDIPRVVSLLHWEPSLLFPLSPSLLLDDYSWYFSLGLTTLALSSVITSISTPGQSTLSNPTSEDQRLTAEGLKTTFASDQQNQSTSITTTQISPEWILWASILIITSLGLVAVSAGNLLTLLLAWVAIDIMELITLLGQIIQSRQRERIIIAFSARMAGIFIVLIAGVMLWSRGTYLTFESISPSIATLLIVTAGLRLGVLPLHLPFIKGLPINRNFGTVLRLVPAASSYILLMRVSTMGLTGVIVSILLAFTSLAGIYAAINWLRARDELEGRPYWLLGISSLAVAAAILQQPAACLAWGIASLLSGGLIFNMSLRHKNLVLLILLGIIILSALPFTPTWQGVLFYQFYSSLGISISAFALFSIFFISIQAFLLAGFFRHILRGIFPTIESPSNHAERWVWFFYPLGLIFLIITHLLIGWLMYRTMQEIPLSSWVMGPLAVIFTGLIIYFGSRYPRIFHPVYDSGIRSAWDRFFSLNWLYRLFWRLFRTLTRLFSLISTALEGEGGILWALVIFALIFVFRLAQK